MRARSILALAVAAICACDSSGELAPASTFPKPEPLSAEVAGRVRRGPDFVAGALVRIAASPGSPDAATWSGGDLAIDSTNDSGFYRFTNAPRQYDLSVRLGGDVCVFRELLPRYVEPSFGDDAVPPAFSARVALTVEPPPAPGRELAFFASGEDAGSVSGDLAAGLTVAIRQFSSARAQALHVVEHEAGDLKAATAYGRSEFFPSATGITPVRVRMAPIAARAEPTTISVAAPAGAQVSDVEIGIFFGSRLTSRHVASVKAGAPITVVAVPDAIFSMRATAARGGASLDSGLAQFFPGAEKLELKMPNPPELESFEAGVLSADGEGVREHRLVGQDGRVVRAVTTARAVALADLARVGAAPLAGTHTWTVRHWPSVARIDKFGGPDARVLPSATSAPRVVTLP